MQNDLGAALASLTHAKPSPPPPAPTRSRRLSTTRTGKIARLPKTVREELNRRLDDGAQGKALVAWLNGLPQVRAAMKEAFGGRPVTEQNLSEWRQGGFLDWQRQQESIAFVRQAAEEARELETESGPTPLADVLGASVTLLLSRLIRELGESQESTPEQRRDLLLLIRQWCVLRSSDHRAAKLKMQQHDWTAAKAAQARREKAQAAAQHQIDPAIRFVEEAALESLTRGLSEAESKELRAAFHAHRAEPFTTQAATGPLTAHPTESDRIAPQKSTKGRKRRHGR